MFFCAKIANFNESAVTLLLAVTLLFVNLQSERNFNAMIGHWIEAMRLRTLPVSVAGVVLATGFALGDGVFEAVPAALCLVFAVLAQIASNFANEYYDYRDGLDRPGREGFRRGVTEGDIAPRAMKRAVFVTLALACAVGLALVFYGGWWLVAVGAVIAVGALAYSAGPYPLSRHALGEVAVFIFFGLVPVNLTYYVQSLTWSVPVLAGSVAVGLMGCNILIVNNYRDCDDDAAVGKTTIAVKFGRRFASTLYLLDGLAAVAVMSQSWLSLPVLWIAVPAIYLVIHVTLWRAIIRLKGAALNPLLGMTAMLMFLYSLGFLLASL